MTEQTNGKIMKVNKREKELCNTRIDLGTSATTSSIITFLL